MANSYVQLAPDQGGKKVRQFENSIGGNIVEAMAVSAINVAAYSNAFVEVAEGSGKKVQYFQNTVAGSTVLAQAVVLVNSAGIAI